MRVSRRKLILFEPSWEQNSEQGRSRMQSLGYIRNMPNHIEAVGGNLIAAVPLRANCNPLNPTVCYIVGVPDNKGIKNDCRFVCPISGCFLTPYSGYYWSEEGGYAYPLMEGIPVLRESAAILMCHR